LDLVIETTPLTTNLIVALCAAREQTELICDRCQNPDEIVVATVEISALAETYAVCGPCMRELPKGFLVA
jgi:hypothetical protein